MEITHSFTISLQNEGNQRFTVDFGDPAFSDLLLDEPPPLGDGAGPNAARVLTAAVANCLSASLLFCLNKARIQPASLTATAETILRRNDKGRLRIDHINVRIHPELAGEDAARIGRCVDIFESFCMVTESVRQGIEVNVEVDPVTIGKQKMAEAPVLA